MLAPVSQFTFFFVKTRWSSNKWLNMQFFWDLEIFFFFFRISSCKSTRITRFFFWFFGFFKMKIQIFRAGMTNKWNIQFLQIFKDSIPQNHQADKLSREEGGKKKQSTMCQMKAGPLSFYACETPDRQIGGIRNKRGKILNAWQGRRGHPASAPLLIGPARGCLGLKAVCG